MIYSVILKNGKTVTMDDEQFEAYQKRLKAEEEQAKNSESPTVSKAETLKKKQPKK